jgi:hypothetical protein
MFTRFTALALFATALTFPVPAEEQEPIEPTGVFMNVSGYFCTTPEQAVSFETTKTPDCTHLTDESAAWVNAIEVKGDMVGHLVFYNMQDDGSYEWMNVYAPLKELRMEKIPVVDEGTLI